ncbi:DUF5723 family protein [Hymenobacter properus]|uniref:DUF5723 domain-containing protein n=1 Tax=Hymenobacter properus TaxID=2791026 RepID=A0A931BIA9_9BACT|nr:DUF5723 family protein [Hymenobacter properus]MBF9142076.1 hypothetical protein [Hymenobacter properus]MBR7720883.1 hypothetical protein [Microvirga sp. SRT04]
MKAPFYYALLALGLALPGSAWAQNELSNFSATGRGGVINTFATDYQVIGINPANLGRNTDFKVAFTIAETGVGAGSQSLTRSTFKNILYNGKQGLTPADRTTLVQQLSGENVLNLNADVTTLGLAVTLPNGLGGIAISNRQRIAGHLALNKNAADVIVNGKSAASLQPYYAYASGNVTPTGQTIGVAAFLEGTAIQAAWTSEFNIAYGLQVVNKTGFQLSAGVGYRYIQGIGIADVRTTGGTLYAYNALSPLFNIDYGNLATGNNFNLESGTGFKPVGSGNGFDFGLAAEIGKIVRVGASVADLGSMTWTGNVLQAQDQKLQQVNSEGLSTYDVITEISKQFSNTESTLFTYEAAKERKADLPAKLRLGGGVRISQFFEAGLDVTLPLNKVAGNLTSPFVGLGVDYKPLNWIKLSSGFTDGAGYGKSLPLGLTFVTPVWEIGVSTRDVVGLVSENSPYSSVAFGLLRFKIGGESTSN